MVIKLYLYIRVYDFPLSVCSMSPLFACFHGMSPRISATSMELETTSEEEGQVHYVFESQDPIDEGKVIRRMEGRVAGESSRNNASSWRGSLLKN